ncbi:MAG: twin-arginine translocase TatA/TatE family subunit [Candidatus Aquicultor secundus]|uniref:Sec-independent protein translocase protein TatA n=1 Tax=Candidatus Aquicultor secundus TaxID=1973895 RepID=A0A2M7T8W8_9ACTN|nr:twin-arginine translocase TatA/TatE family subunit [Solirubrobacter sp.]PIU27338.1 MAG: twin-arginine translocase TatA/TatE family subunit [Candidatus Aquicultor secundus]PIW21892.1 MAG: twin-arginine translocase TatA/TatE family subunit [Candidatus Aquicultor secundus]PIX52013.1 MAG: twin-arginine translocase TatA/TatE family subunit [Candidatus Aquicultor secundus]PIY39660.1 MAG: twin-arginine translocase TatA/TatE family subunit [Candidatus Aquicultor secundus]
MPSLGWPELVIILVIVLVIFGPKKLPGIGKAIGQSIRELKKSSNPKEDKKEEK